MFQTLWRLFAEHSAESEVLAVQNRMCKQLRYLGEWDKVQCRDCSTLKGFGKK